MAARRGRRRRSMGRGTGRPRRAGRAERGGAGRGGRAGRGGPWRGWRAPPRGPSLRGSEGSGISPQVSDVSRQVAAIRKHLATYREEPVPALGSGFGSRLSVLEDPASLTTSAPSTSERQVPRSLGVPDHVDTVIARDSIAGAAADARFSGRGVGGDSDHDAAGTSGSRYSLDGGVLSSAGESRSIGGGGGRRSFGSPQVELTGEAVVGEDLAVTNAVVGRCRSTLSNPT
jgi:hypothetical protein